jgi:hypothetical protein
MAALRIPGHELAGALSAGTASAIAALLKAGQVLEIICSSLFSQLSMRKAASARRVLHSSTGFNDHA